LARVQALTELRHELPLQSAEHMVAIWQCLPKVDRAAERHQPMLWNDDFPTRVRTVSAIVHHADVSPSQKRDAS